MIRVGRRYIFTLPSTHGWHSLGKPKVQKCFVPRESCIVYSRKTDVPCDVDTPKRNRSGGLFKSSGWRDIIHEAQLSEKDKMDPLPLDENLEQIYIPLSQDIVDDGPELTSVITGLPTSPPNDGSAALIHAPTTSSTQVAPPVQTAAAAAPAASVPLTHVASHAQPQLEAPQASSPAAAAAAAAPQPATATTPAIASTAPATTAAGTTTPTPSKPSTTAGPRLNEDGWPCNASGKPLEPEPYECCGNDCPNCVWIQYDEQMQKYKAKRAAVNKV